MVLTDREIQAAIEHGHIKVDPTPGPDAWTSTSLDLTLAPEIRIWNPPDTGGIEQIVCPAASTGSSCNTFAQTFTTATSTDSPGFVVKPGDLLLAWTNEHIELKPHARLAARVEGKSSLARLGIGVHVTAPTIHAGVVGPIQPEVCHHGPRCVRFTAGMPICRLIFEQTLGVPAKGCRGQCFNQVRA